MTTIVRKNICSISALIFLLAIKLLIIGFWLFTFIYSNGIQENFTREGNIPLNVAITISVVLLLCTILLSSILIHYSFFSGTPMFVSSSNVELFENQSQSGDKEKDQKTNNQDTFYSSEHQKQLEKQLALEQANDQIRQRRTRLGLNSVNTTASVEDLRQQLPGNNGNLANEYPCKNCKCNEITKGKWNEHMANPNLPISEQDLIDISGQTACEIHSKEIDSFANNFQNQTAVRNVIKNNQNRLLTDVDFMLAMQCFMESRQMVVPSQWHNKISTAAKYVNEGTTNNTGISEETKSLP